MCHLLRRHVLVRKERRFIFLLKYGICMINFKEDYEKRLPSPEASISKN